MAISELWKTCNALDQGYDDNLRVNQRIRKVLAGEKYAIDPDGPLGVDPFMVVCQHSETVVPSIGRYCFS